ncbi:EutP/PduV family microcompartment system protein, partial [Klebsiella pneumoniae]|uniref:EutP/PduV family microcompartment system protein n=1 Tax=Klebsiella pneumoniae TaxID=573 RepID=UPI002380CF70
MGSLITSLETPVTKTTGGLLVLPGNHPLIQRRRQDERTLLAIDTPGEYLENRCLYSALLTSACEADVIALVLNADAPWSPFS